MRDNPSRIMTLEAVDAAVDRLWHRQALAPEVAMQTGLIDVNRLVHYCEGRWGITRGTTRRVGSLWRKIDPLLRRARQEQRHAQVWKVSHYSAGDLIHVAASDETAAKAQVIALWGWLLDARHHPVRPSSLEVVCVGLGDASVVGELNVALVASQRARVAKWRADVETTLLRCQRFEGAFDLVLPENDRGGEIAVLRAQRDLLDRMLLQLQSETTTDVRTSIS